MAKGLARWFSENWVDLSRPKPGGGFEPCGRRDASKGSYPKCVPASRAARMTQAEIDSAVRRKRQAESTQRREGQKPIMVSTEVEKHGSHDQSTHGNRGPNSARAAAIASRSKPDQMMTGANTPQVLAKLASDGGFTWNPKRNERRSKGYVVAISKDYERKIGIDEFEQKGAQVVADYARQNAEVLAQPGAHLGAWRDGNSIYLDVSIVQDTASRAADVGRANDQIGIFDLGNFRTWYRHQSPTTGEYKYLPTARLRGYERAGIDLVGKADTGVMFVAGTDLSMDNINKIVSELLSTKVNKESPTVSDVHVPTIMGGKRKRQPTRPFKMAKKQPLKDPKGGLTAAGRAHFKRTEGANLKPGVKGVADTPEKMRRKGSFLTRFFTNPSGPMRDEKGKPTRLALSAAAWGEPVPKDRSDAAALAAKGRRLLDRYEAVKKHASHDQSTHGRRGPSDRAKRIVANSGERIQLSELGIEDAPRSLARTAMRTRDDDALWAKAKPTKVSWKDEFLGTEGSVKTKHVKKVVIDGEPLREGYPPRLYRLPSRGRPRYLIADGHHRLAMHSLLESTSFDAVVLDYPLSSPRVRRVRSGGAQWLGKHAAHNQATHGNRANVKVTRAAGLKPPTPQVDSIRDHRTGYLRVRADADVPGFDLHDKSSPLPSKFTVEMEQVGKTRWQPRVVVGPWHEKNARGSYYEGRSLDGEFNGTESAAKKQATKLFKEQYAAWAKAGMKRE